MQHPVEILTKRFVDNVVRAAADEVIRRTGDVDVAGFAAYVAAWIRANVDYVVEPVREALATARENRDLVGWVEAGLCADAVRLGARIATDYLGARS